MDKRNEGEDDENYGYPPLSEGSKRLFFSSEMELRSPFPQACKLPQVNCIFDNVTINHALH